MYSITVTIGRNVGDVPMPEQRWEEFKRDVQGTLANYADPSDQAEYADGHGVWGYVPEQMHKRTLLSNYEPDEAAMMNLSRELSELARFYDQDAIALTIGTSTLC